MTMQAGSAGVFNNGVRILSYASMKNSVPKYPKGQFVFNVKFSPFHCFTLNAQKFTVNTQSEMTVIARQRLDEWRQRKDSLWWSCLSQMEVGKRTVRSYQARRARQAFVESLRKRGYNSDGSPIPGTQEKPALFGTIMIGTKAETLKVKYDVLLEQTDILVKMIIEKSGQGRESEGLRSGGKFGNDRGPRIPRTIQDGQRQRRPFTMRRT